MNKEECTIEANKDSLNYGTDPCPNIVKILQIEAQCSNGGYLHSNWDFSYMNEIVEDFMTAVNPFNNETDRSVISMSTIPNWMFAKGYNNHNGMYTSYSDSVYDASWGYEIGNANNLSSASGPSAAGIGEYFNRLYQYYTNKGFYDEYNQFIASNYSYIWDTWEVLNEPEGEYGQTPQSYTLIYDSVTTLLSKQSSSNLKFLGLALEGHNEWNWYNYFLNKSNHLMGNNTQIDYISFHFYASCGNRTDVNEYSTFFGQLDTFVTEVSNIIELKNKYDGNIKLDIDEFGVILPNDNDAGTYVAPPPDIYFNAVGGVYAYAFMRLGLLGVDILGSSQLMGYPSINNTWFNKNGITGLTPQYQSVSMLRWQSGIGNARYWVLKMLIEHFQVGDKINNGSNNGGNETNGDVFYYQAYTSVDGNKNEYGSEKVLIVNKQNYAINVQFVTSKKYNYDNGGILYVVDEINGDTDARKVAINNNTLSLNRFAVGVFYPTF